MRRRSTKFDLFPLTLRWNTFLSYCVLLDKELGLFYPLFVVHPSPLTITLILQKGIHMNALSSQTY